METSPMAVLTLGYKPGFLEPLEIFGAGYHDADGDMADVEISYPVMEKLSGSVFLFASGGDSRPLDDRSPFLCPPCRLMTGPRFFFNGGFARYNIEEHLTLAGVTWDGVVAPDIGLDFQPHPKIVTRLKSALLYSENGSLGSDSRYGWETDAEMTYEFYKDLRLFLEAGVLVQGDYWKKRLGYRPDPSARLAAGLDLTF